MYAKTNIYHVLTAYDLYTTQPKFTANKMNGI